jgi:NAD+ synthetase
MKIALGQINTTVGDIAGNVNKMVEYAGRARAAGADLIVFHELCIPGYPPKELLHRRDFASANGKALDRLREQCPGIGIVCGYVEPEGQGSDRRIYSAAALLSDGKIILRHRKNHLSALTGFDERTHFSPGRGGAVADFRGVRIGLAISEDAWADKDFWETGRKRRTLLGRLVRAGAELLIVISSSPFWPGKVRERERAARALALRYGVPLVFVNQVGGNDSLIFDGGSFAVRSDDAIVARAGRFEENLVIADLETNEECGAEERDDVEDVRKALVLGTRDFIRKCGFEKAVLGLSGGIDSAVVACIAVEALGKENVLALVMPSMYSPPDSLRDAVLVAENLGLESRTVSIEPIYRAYIEALRTEFEGLPEDVTEENIQARIRGNLLMAFANKFRHLVLATGNRSEAMTGYCTLYGDAAGGLAVIADVPKMIVYRIAEKFNSAGPGEVIPRRVIEKEPSAELKPGQRDADTLPPYPVLDPILTALLDEGKTPDEIAAMGYDREMVRDVVRRVYRSEHKRRQSPPVLFVSKSALIPGRTRPISAAIEDMA